MKVYHFINEKYGLQALKKKRLKISRICDLNDPFEFLGFDKSNKDLRDLLNIFKKSYHSEIGIICFSKTWRDPVQWAHYADKHYGLCLCFEIPRQNLLKIKYIETPLSENEFKSGDLRTKLLTTKFKNWDYEKEFRLVVDLNKKTYDLKSKLHFKDFDNDIKLTKIIIGARSKITETKVKDILGNNTKGIEIIYSRAAFKSFKIVKQNNKKLRTRKLKSNWGEATWPV